MRTMPTSRTPLYFLMGLLLSLILALKLFAQSPTARAVYIPYADAQPVLKQLDEILPAELKNQPPERQSTLWADWVTRRDAAIRARLRQGDEDSLVNFLVFGTSYTKQPRLTPGQLVLIGDKQSSLDPINSEQSALIRLLNARIDDLIKGAASPGNNERLLFAQRLLTKYKGFTLQTPTGREQAKAYLAASLHRVLSESAAYTRVLEQARLLGSATEEFAERSRLYSSRGLSSDTSLFPNFAIEESLKAMQTSKLWAPLSIHRVAVIGPGLDFTDKQEGYDFYPQQTIQPFAIIDTLLRLGLARADTLQVTTFDLSPRVNDHLTEAVRRSRQGQGYTIQLPRDPLAPWKSETISYWDHFGEQVGKSVPPVSVPTVSGELKVRAIRIRPDITSRITPLDLNIVLQRMNLAPADQFDLIVATNILVYYDVFEQTLALTNIERMLRPGGFLLSNNALIEFPFSKMRSIDYLTIVYSDRSNDGDHIVWYRRSE